MGLGAVSIEAVSKSVDYTQEFCTICSEFWGKALVVSWFVMPGGCFPIVQLEESVAVPHHMDRMILVK